MHEHLNKEHLRIREAAAAYFMNATAESPTSWHVDCAETNRCKYGAKGHFIKVIWESQRYTFERFDEGEDINEIVKDAAEGIALLLLAHLMDLKVLRKLQIGERCDWQCHDGTLLEVSGTRFKRYLQSRKRAKIQQARTNPGQSVFLVFVGDVVGFEGCFVSG